MPHRPFFKDLVDFMISGPVVAQVLQGENAVLKNRDIMGATDPKKADAGTIRAEFAESIEANSVHGSDAPEAAAQEIASSSPASISSAKARQPLLRGPWALSVTTPMAPINKVFLLLFVHKK